MKEAAKILTLAHELSLPEPVLPHLERSAEALPDDLPIQALASPDTAGEAWKEIHSRIPGWKEDDGMSQLVVTLAASFHTREAYRIHGISDAIWLATMDCLRRFLDESRVVLGRWAYDRGFWTWRQTGCLLFRLGTLEFEYLAPEKSAHRPAHLQDVPVLSVHIPSDAVLTAEELDRSYALAKRFFTENAASLYPQGCPQAALCSSWLLSPALEEILPENSAIRRFEADYSRFRTEEDDTDFYRWLFENPTPVPVEDLPERTSLQRRAKAYLAGGGKIGMACGQYIPQIF